MRGFRLARTTSTVGSPHRTFVGLYCIFIARLSTALQKCSGLFIFSLSCLWTRLDFLKCSNLRWERFINFSTWFWLFHTHGPISPSTERAPGTFSTLVFMTRRPVRYSLVVEISFPSSHQSKNGFPIHSSPASGIPRAHHHDGWDNMHEA